MSTPRDEVEPDVAHELDVDPVTVQHDPVADGPVRVARRRPDEDLAGVVAHDDLLHRLAPAVVDLGLRVGHPTQRRGDLVVDGPVRRHRREDRAVQVDGAEDGRDAADDLGESDGAAPVRRVPLDRPARPRLHRRRVDAGGVHDVGVAVALAHVRPGARLIGRRRVDVVVGRPAAGVVGVARPRRREGLGALVSPIGDNEPRLGHVLRDARKTSWSGRAVSGCGGG